MIPYRLVVLSTLAVCLRASDLSFPPNFKFGAVSDSVRDIWNITDNSTKESTNTTVTGSVAEDIQRAVNLGLHFYRFSISWSDLMPKGFANEVNEDARRYYSDLIDGLREKGVEPVVTLYQRSIPQRLQNLGGWANPLVADWFAAYSRVVFSLYADRVKTWITINDPLIICDGGYSGLVSPGLNDPLLGSYLCSKNVLIAHAKAWRIYDEEYRLKYHGEISLSNQIIWYEPSRRSDKELADLAMENCAGRYSHPIYSKEGGWPPALEELIKEKSKSEGFTKSRLPAFSKAEIELVRGTYDFYGVNHYTSRTVRQARNGEKVGPWPLEGSPELGVILETKPDWKPTTIWWFKQNPQGLRNVLVWLKEQYGDLRYLVTGNGYYSEGDQPEDSEKVNVYKDYLIQLLLAIKKDDVHVTGYTAWSLLEPANPPDKYGNNNQTETTDQQDVEHILPISTASFYASVIKYNSLDVPDDSKPYTAWISIAAGLTVLVVLAFVIKGVVAARKNKRIMQYEDVPLHETAEVEQNGKLQDP